MSYTREQHLQWSKGRALAYRDPVDMWVSFVSDMKKHPETRDEPTLEMGSIFFNQQGMGMDVGHFISTFNQDFETEVLK